LASIAVRQNTPTRSRSQTLTINTASAELAFGLVVPAAGLRQTCFHWRWNDIALWANVLSPGALSSRAITSQALLRDAAHSKATQAARKNPKPPMLGPVEVINGFAALA